jgi:ferrous iron transport protein B
MSCPRTAPAAGAAPPVIRLRARPLRIALVGQPNVGKSALFGRLTGRYATVSNYPGTTVAVTRGRALVGAEVCDVIDTPGVNALEGVLSEDELITRRVLEAGEADLVVQVADAKNLRRALQLTAHLAAFRQPMVLALNMVDEAHHAGIVIDTETLSERTGVPVVEIVATEGRGLEALRVALADARRPDLPARINGEQLRWAQDLATACRVGTGRRAARWQELIARAVRQPLTGLPLLALVLYLFYLAVGVFGAQTLVGWVEDGLFGSVINPAATSFVGQAVPFAWLQDLLVGEFGLITMGLTYAIAIVLPVVATFFLVFGFLEDSGYIPRVAIFSDRLFRTIGLNGKAVLPMVLGLGCDTMATMTTRILGTPKERLIAILLLALGVPCSAQLATIFGILGGISFWALLTLFGVVTGQIFLVGFLAARVLPGDRSDFVLELPPIRLPGWKNLLVKTGLRVRWYLREAVPIFLGGTLLLWGLDRVGALAWISRVGEPVMTGMLGLPASMSGVFIMGFLRRDYGAAGLFALAHDGALTGVQAVVALTVMTLFVPCVANFLMMVKERGWRVGLAIVGVITPIAVLTGTVLNHGLRFFGFSF